MDKIKNPPESKIELLPERLNDTSKLTEVIPDNVNITVLEEVKAMFNIWQIIGISIGSFIGFSLFHIVRRIIKRVLEKGDI